MGLKEGLPQSIIDVVRYRKGVEGLPETEAVVIQLGLSDLYEKEGGLGTFPRSKNLWTRTFGGSVTLGYYTSTAALLITFDNQLDAR